MPKKENGLSYIINLGGKILRIYDNRKSLCIIKLSVSLVVINCLLSNLGIYNYRTSPALLVSSLVMIILSLVLFKKEASLDNISWLTVGVFLVIGVSYGIAGIIYRVPTYIVNGFIFVLQLPLFYLCIKQHTIEKVVFYYAKAYVILSTILLLVCILVYPLGAGQYQGVFNNPNLTGEFLTTLSICTLYVFQRTSHSVSKTASAILFGISFALVIFTRSRTSILACVFILIAYVVYLIRGKEKIGKSVVALLLSVVVAFPITFFFLNNITPYTSATVIEIADRSGCTLAIFDNLDESEEPNNNSIKDELEASTDRLLKGINNDSSFSSGRVQIWQAYIENISIKPHRPDLVSFTYDGQTLKANAHNSFLQVAYQSGILSGLLYLILYTIAGITALITLFRYRASLEGMFAIMVLANSVPYVLLSNTFGPYTSFSLLPFWIISVPYFLNVNNKKSNASRKDKDRLL